MDHIIQHTVEVLLQGGTILYPTDTIWGIGCDARNCEAVERLYNIKERDHSKSMLVLVGNMNNPYSHNNLIIPNNRPTTYILPKEIWQDEMHLEIAPNLPAADGSLGVRMPQHQFCLDVIRRLGAPLVSTSANLSGRPSPSSYKDIEKALIERIDYCVPPLQKFLSDETRGSCIIKINSDGSQTLLRP